MIWRVEVFSRKEELSKDLVSQIEELGIRSNLSVFLRKVFFIEASLKEEDIIKISSSLLTDKVLDDFKVSNGVFPKRPSWNEVVIAYNPGVFDSVASSLSKAIKDIPYK